jgi:hypothetical protein
MIYMLEAVSAHFDHPEAAPIYVVALERVDAEP